MGMGVENFVNVKVVKTNNIKIIKVIMMIKIIILIIIIIMIILILIIIMILNKKMLISNIWLTNY
jgi:hypothetical protein